jgi:hypothetical protein
VSVFHVLSRFGVCVSGCWLVVCLFGLYLSSSINEMIRSPPACSRKNILPI